MTGDLNLSGSLIAGFKTGHSSKWFRTIGHPISKRDEEVLCLKEKIKRLKEMLKVWNMEHFGDTSKKLRKIEVDLNKLKEDTIDRQLFP